jgi:predicted enzyme related to lactoylglutathione lyase
VTEPGEGGGADATILNASPGPGAGAAATRARPNLRIAEVVFDCNRPDVAVAFWAAALGYERGWTSGQFSQLHDPAGRGMTLLFQMVPERKAGKNRVHIDLATPDMAGEVARLALLGARALREVAEMGANWTVMSDPQGNEFCVVNGAPQED